MALAQGVALELGPDAQKARLAPGLRWFETRRLQNRLATLSLGNPTENRNSFHKAGACPLLTNRGINTARNRTSASRHVRIIHLPGHLISAGKR